MKVDVRCPGRCNALLFKREGTTVFIKCRKCKEEKKFAIVAMTTAWSS